MKTLVQEKTIIFYGKNWTPLSDECYGCHNYGYLCAGSVYETECRAGIVEDIVPSVLANLVLRQTQNPFTLARVWGYDLEKDIKEEEIEKMKDNELYEKYKQALGEPENVIQKYIDMYGLEVYGSKERYIETEENEVDHSTSKNDIGSNPFEDPNLVEVKEDEDLPF